MKEKILALLQAKFAGVRKDGLAQMALVLSLQIDKEDEATALVEKLTADNVNNFVKDWRSAVDKEVSDGTKTHEATLRKKYDLVEKKEQEPGKQDPKSTDPNNETPAWAKALIETNQKLTERLNSIEGEKTTNTRLQVLQQKFAVIPEGNKLAEEFKAQKLKDFKRMNFESDEAFNEYLTEVESGVSSFNQNLADSNLSEQGKPIFGKKEADGVSTGVKQFVQSKKEEAEKGKPLDGKAV